MAFGGRDELLERGRELARVRAALEGARRGAGRLLLVRGRVGLGKSRLLSAALAMGAVPGVARYSAAGTDLESALPFGVVLQLFESLAVSADPSLFAGAAALAGAALRGEDRREARDGEGLAVQHGLYWLTSNLAERGPVIIAVDDAHWADEASLRYVAYLARRLEELPVVVLLSDRTGEPTDRRHLLDEVVSLPVTETLELAPLGDDSMAELVRERIPDADSEFCAACVEVAGGNPLFLREMLLELEREDVRPTAAAASRIGQLVPESISRMALRRIGRLPGAASATAGAVAVLGEDATSRHVAVVAEIEESTAAAALDALATAEILRAGDRPGFDHPLIRAAVYDEIPAQARAAAHRRAAEVLHAEGAAPERVATHLLSAARGLEGWAIGVLRQAAASARARGAPDAALPYLRRALEQPSNAGDRAGLLVELAEAQAAAGIEGASEHFTAAAELVQDPEARARILFLFGRRLSMTGRFPEATEVFERALRELGEADTPLRTRLEAGYVSAARLNVDTRDAAIERMNALLERVGDGSSSDMVRMLCGNRAFELAVAGESRAEVVRLARIAVADGPPRSDAEADGTGYYSASTALAWADRLEEADEALAAAMATGQNAGSLLMFARASAWRAWVLYRLGRVPEAIASAESALDHRGYGPDVLGPAINAVRALALLDLGDREAAAATLEIDDRERWQHSAPFAYYLDARGWLALSAGRPQDACEDFEDCGRLLDALRVNNPALVTWRWGGAVAAARAGDPERAAALADDGLELARRFGAERPLGLLMLARGLVESSPEAALPHLESAVATLARSEARLDHARALHALGVALRRTRRLADARERLRTALDIAHRSGAVAVEASVREELVAAGGRPRRPALSGASALTPGERRVAEMVARGMTNREIAQALFITMKGVQWHLRHVYRKLEVSSRDEIGTALEER